MNMNEAEIFNANDETLLEAIPVDLNFCRIFELPPVVTLPRSYCFGGGHIIPCKMVDWFQPIPNAFVRKETEGLTKVKTWGQLKPQLIEFVMRKNYIKNQFQYILITDFGQSVYIIGKRG